jgi:carboxymethylenebutenolidase
LTRRDFLDRLTKIAGSTAAAMALLPLLENDYAKAAIVVPNDSRLVTERAFYPAPNSRVGGYLVRLKGGGRRPSILVVHENRGLNPHIEDVARRLAVEGFLAFAVDLLSPLGGTPAVEDEARAMIGRLDAEETVARLVAGVAFLKEHGESNGKVGAIGFCWGGSMVNQLAVASQSLSAAVPYYGSQPPASDVPKISAPLLLHYAGLDRRINAGIEAFEAALKQHGKRYTMHVYPDVDHAFNNDTSSRYNKAAADLAWSRTVAFLKEHLGAARGT